MNNNLSLLDTSQVAGILNVKLGTIEKSRSTCSGDFSPFIKFGRSVRYRKVDVEDWIAAHRIDIVTQGVL